MRSVLALLLFAAACSSTRDIREEVRPLKGGQAAAAYKLPLGAEAAVWSKGIYRKELLGRESTVIHVGIAIDNDGKEPIVLDAGEARLDEVDVGDATLTSVPASKLDGDVIIQPGEEREVTLYFTLPDEVEPQDVDAFAVRWGARVGGETFVRTTGFRETTRLRYDPLADVGAPTRLAHTPDEPVVY